MTSHTETMDIGRADGWADSTDRGPDLRQPRLRILFHADPQRIGATCALPADQWIPVGRRAPDFAGPGQPARPLADSRVSRAQLEVRWRPEAGCFEVAPEPGARRPLARVPLDPQQPPLAPITAPTRLPPDTCLAIGDLVMLGLELARAEPPTADRMGLVGESQAMWTLRSDIAEVARFGRPALINGPTGAGKELVAQAVHAQSTRAHAPFVPVNCAALPEQLVESTLFGHKRGAFTGADRDQAGLFRAADQGTLFLDELGELPLALQPKLLRALQEGMVVPVGTHRGHPVDVRLVAATHRDLAAQVAQGTLREDLYHRVAGHVIQVPGLDARRLDIPELFVFVLDRLRADHPELEWMWRAGAEGRAALPIRFFADLMRRPWTGNVRELQNCAERTARLNLTPGAFRSPLAPDHPPGQATALATGPNTLAPPAPSASELLGPAADTLGLAHKTVDKLIGDRLAAFEAQAAAWPAPTRAERLHALAADALFALLIRFDFVQSAVASDLGVSRTTLIKLMHTFGLPRAADLTADQIAEARAAVGGDLDRAAERLRVSPRALKTQLTRLNTPR